MLRAAAKVGKMLQGLSQLVEDQPKLKASTKSLFPLSPLDMIGDPMMRVVILTDFVVNMNEFNLFKIFSTRMFPRPKEVRDPKDNLENDISCLYQVRSTVFGRAAVSLHAEFVFLVAIALLTESLKD